MSLLRTRSFRPKLSSLPPFDALWSYRFREASDLNTLRAARAAMVWRASRGFRAAWQVIRYLAWLPIFPKQLVSSLIKNARTARREFGRGYASQISDILKVAAVGGLRPRDYYRAGLARHGGGKAIFRHVSFNLVRTVTVEITALRNSESLQLTKDKYLFERRCRDAGFAVVRTIALLRGGEIFDAAGQPFRRPLPPCHLIVKPVDDGQGKGIERWLHQASGYYLRSPGDLMSNEDALRRAAQISREHDSGVLIQECLANHPLLLPFAGSALATTRIVTIPNEIGDPEVVDAFYRTSFVPNAAVDNFHSGGVLFPIDIASGRLLPGFKDVPYEPPKITHHAETGVAMSGCRHPGWEAMTVMARRLHRAFPDFLLVGWDIALGPEGPVVVEANIPPGISSNRQGIFGGLVGTRMLSLLAFHAAQWLEETEPAGSRWRPQLATVPVRPAPRPFADVRASSNEP